MSTKPSVVKQALVAIREVTDKGVLYCAAEWAPTVPARSAYGNKLHGDASLELFREVLQICLHEEAHASAMRHLYPTCTPAITLNVTARITDEGVGINISGGAVRANVKIDDPHECVVVSVAGVLGEILVPPLALKNMLSEESQNEMPPNPFTRITGRALAALVFHPGFVTAFPGSETDLEEIYRLTRDKFVPNDDMEESARMEAVLAVSEFAADACAAAIRIVIGDAEGIAARARERAVSIITVTMEQSALIGGAADRIRGAGYGLYTQEDCVKDQEAAEAKESSTWHGEHTKGQA